MSSTEFKVGDEVYFHFQGYDHEFKCEKAEIVSIDPVHGYDGNNCTILFAKKDHTYRHHPPVYKMMYFRWNTAALSKEPYKPLWREEENDD